MSDIVERASGAAMRLWGLRENEAAETMAECRAEIERLRALVEAAYDEGYRDCPCDVAHASTTRAALAQPGDAA